MPVGDAAQTAGELRARGRARGPPARARQVRPPSKASSPQRLLGGREEGAGGGRSHGPVVEASCPGAGPFGRTRLPPSPQRAAVSERESEARDVAVPPPGVGGQTPGWGEPPRRGWGCGAALRGTLPLRWGWGRSGMAAAPSLPHSPGPAPRRSAAAWGRPSAGPGGAGRGEGGGGSRGAPRPQRRGRDPAGRRRRGSDPVPGPHGQPGSGRGAEAGWGAPRVAGGGLPKESTSPVCAAGLRSRRMPHRGYHAWVPRGRLMLGNAPVIGSSSVRNVLGDLFQASPRSLKRSIHP